MLPAAFVVGGFLTPMEWGRLGPENFVTPLGLIAGAMLIFLSYEGFELMARDYGIGFSKYHPRSE